ncbi:MAG: hypothetical protein JWM10_1488 [Myxococcaceae bacterium]|nr:hypothetical protein [Myxococcaceae bacterium]
MVCAGCGSTKLTADGQCVRCGLTLTPTAAPTPFRKGVRTVPRVIGPRLGLPWAFFAIGAMLASGVVPEIIRRRRAAEAVANLQRIYDAELAYYNRSSELSVGQFVSASATPAGAPTATRYPANPSAWRRDPGWRALGFSLGARHYYQYRVTTDGVGIGAYGGRGAGFTITAIGDLDGDGVRSTFSREGFLFRGEFNAAAPVIINESE